MDGSALWADTLVCGVVRTFSDRLHSLFLARECRDLEEEMGATTNLTGRILGRWEDGEAIYWLSRLCLLCDCPSLCKDFLLHHLLVHCAHPLG